MKLQYQNYFTCYETQKSREKNYHFDQNINISLYVVVAYISLIMYN